jgi:acetolactate synthase-1/2/3 large subunit
MVEAEGRHLVFYCNSLRANERLAMEAYQGSDVFIEVLNANGVEHVFFNPGIDNVHMLEAISKYRAMNRQAPTGILCLDEFVAMTAAHGNHMVSGRPQAVLVHSELGTQQVGGAMHNAQWGRVPVVLCAESLGPEKRMDWRQEPYNPGSMVRNCVKWDHELKDNEGMGEVLQEAFRIAATEPCGPVYLTLPRDIYTRPYNRSKEKSLTEFSIAAIRPADPDLLGMAAEILLDARDPLIITGYSGRHIENVESLITLAEMLSAQVLPADIRMNFPNTHPLFACLDPKAGMIEMNPYLPTADVILAIDYDMHYAAPPTAPRSDARIIHMDIDLKKRGEPLWGREPDIPIEADSREAIPALVETIRERLSPERRDLVQKRFERLKRAHEQLRNDWADLAAGQAGLKPILPDWLCKCIDEAITEDTLIVNQTITPSVSVAHQIKRTQPGSLISCAGGSIGWALGAGLGAKLASPDKTVVSLMGDGAFIYGCPVATLWTASFYQIPYLTIIFNNQAYGAIKGLFRERYDVDNMGADIRRPPGYAQVAEACHACGCMVEDPSDIVPVLEKALTQVRKGRPAVVDVRLNQSQ